MTAPSPSRPCPLISEERFNQIALALPKLEPILVVGDLGLDKYTCGEVLRISPEAPVPVLSVDREWEKLGLAANVADNLKGLNIPCTLCGVVGDDLRAQRLVQQLNARGMGSDGLVYGLGRPTTFKERITTPTQQICRIDYEETGPISEEVEAQIVDRVKALLPHHSGIILEDYGKGTLTAQVAAEIIALAQDAGKMVAADPSAKAPPATYRGATLLKPNLKEARAMVQALGMSPSPDSKDDLENMARHLVGQLRVEQLVLTLGSEGMALFPVASALRMIPTVAQEVFDVSGAGDTTIGLLTAALLAGASLDEAAWIGNCAAGVVVAKRGTATVSADELRAFYRRLRERF